MASKPKPVVLKGQEAEDKVLGYMKRMNRPFGAVDVAANLKGAIPKTVVQKTLVALAEKGVLTQKIYGKTTFFVYNQANIDSLPAEAISGLKSELSSVEDHNQLLAAEIKALTTELSKLKSTPTDVEINQQIADTEAVIVSVTASLQPLRSGAPPISPEEREQVHAAWVKWRAEWIRRRRIFITFWQLATDVLPPQDAKSLEEDLGIEGDTPEHVVLEKESSCSLKRKRE